MGFPIALQNGLQSRYNAHYKLFDQYVIRSLIHSTIAFKASGSLYGRLCQSPCAVGARRLITLNVPAGVVSAENSTKLATKAASIPKGVEKTEHRSKRGIKSARYST